MSFATLLWLAVRGGGGGAGWLVERLRARRRARDFPTVTVMARGGT